MRTLYLDCFSGISGDMTVGALIDAGAPFDDIRTALDSLGVAGFHVEAERITKRGIAASQFRVVQDDAQAQVHRHLKDIVEIIGRATLPGPVKKSAIATFTLLAEAEAAVHNTSIEEVHFHEVGAIDAIADIVAAQLAMHLLHIERVVCSRLAVGSGTVSCAHGILPVPAPATAKLLEGKPIYGGGVDKELVTPTGAAIVAQCVEVFGEAPPMKLRATGYGSGTRDLPDRANVLRVLLGDTEDAIATPETITVLETNIDDMNPELLPSLIEAFLREGARDAFITPVLGKKGRPAQQVTVLCDEEATQKMARIFFENSSTLGLRIRREKRIVLKRSSKTVLTEWGKVRVKLGFHDDATANVAPEFEDCRSVAETAGVAVKRVYEAALAAALRGEYCDA